MLEFHQKCFFLSKWRTTYPLLFLVFLAVLCMSTTIYVLFMALDIRSNLMSICVFYLCQFVLLSTKCLLMLGHLLIFKLFRPTPQIWLSGLAKHSFCCLKSDSCLHRVIIVIILCLCFPYFKLGRLWNKDETDLGIMWSSCDTETFLTWVKQRFRLFSLYGNILSLCEL